MTCLPYMIGQCSRKKTNLTNLLNRKYKIHPFFVHLPSRNAESAYADSTCQSRFRRCQIKKLAHPAVHVSGCLVTSAQIPLFVRCINDCVRYAAHLHAVRALRLQTQTNFAGIWVRMFRTLTDHLGDEE